MIVLKIFLFVKLKSFVILNLDLLKEFGNRK